MNQTKEILLTGAFGFLGRRVTQQLLDEGFIVHAMDLPAATQSQSSVIDSHRNLRVIGFDITKDGLSKVVPRSIDTVIHLAGLTSVIQSFERPLEYLKVNTEGTVRLLLSVAETNAKRFILSSTAAVYVCPDGKPITESSNVEPSNPYGVSKLAAEQFVNILSSNLGMEWVVLRFFNLFGPGLPLNQPGIISDFIKSLLENKPITINGDGSHERSFVHVQDAARAIVLSVSAASIANKIVNICGKSSIPVIDIARAMQTIFGKTNDDIVFLKEKQPLVKISHCKGSRAKEDLGYNPQIDFWAGLEEFTMQIMNRSRN